MSRAFTYIASVVCLWAAFVGSSTATDRWIEVKGGQWHPSVNTINRLVQELPDFVHKAAAVQGQKLRPWNSYRFQYQGQTTNGGRFIFVNSFCADVGVSNIRENWVLVLDGGSCFFNLKYDPSQKQFYELQINGEA